MTFIHAEAQQNYEFIVDYGRVMMRHYTHYPYPLDGKDTSNHPKVGGNPW